METTKLSTPLGDREIEKLKTGDQIEINGMIYCGRDAVLPKITQRIQTDSLDQINVILKGSVIFHTAVSIAGIGPTTSNKLEIEESMSLLSKVGVKIHIGKGSIGSETIRALNTYNAAFAITPPVSALFSDKIISQKIAAYPEEGMEAFYELEVKGFPAIIACIHGETLFSDHSNET